MLASAVDAPRVSRPLVPRRGGRPLTLCPTSIAPTAAFASAAAFAALLELVAVPALLHDRKDFVARLLVDILETWNLLTGLIGLFDRAPWRYHMRTRAVAAHGL